MYKTSWHLLKIKIIVLRATLFVLFLRPLSEVFFNIKLSDNNEKHSVEGA
jgi:hypothetical protein